MVRIRSSAIRFLISTPARAACSVEIAITSGMARPEGVRAGDDQNRHGAGDSLGQAAQQRPGDERDDTGDGCEVEQERRCPVREGLRLGGGGLRFGYQPLDAGQRRVIPDGRDGDPDGVVSGNGPGHDRVPHSAQDRFGLPGDHGLIKLGLTVNDSAVGGHPRAGPDQDDVTGPQFGNLHGFGPRCR